MKKPGLSTRKRKIALAVGVVLSIAAATAGITNGFGLTGGLVTANQRVNSGGAVFTLSSPSIAGDPGGTSITETVNNMYQGDYRERLVTLTPGTGYSPAIGVAISAVQNSDATTTALSSTQAGDAMTMLRGSNQGTTAGQPGGNADAGQGGLYAEIYSCAGTWSSAAGAVSTATDDRDYTCSVGGANGVLLGGYDIPATSNSRTTSYNWVVPPLGSAQSLLIRTRFAEDASTDLRQNTQLAEQATLTYKFQSGSPLISNGSSDAGALHACAVRSNATLWCWGNNGSGQLGVGDTVTRNSPTQVGTGSDWATVTTGIFHTCATKTTGTLWCWGTNGDYQLGLGDNTQRDTPTQVGALTTWSQISAWWYHTCALKTDGTIWCWGQNSAGEVGDGTNTPRDTPTQAGAATTYTSVTSYAYGTCARRTNSTVWCWGTNEDGQLGNGATGGAVNTPTQVGVATNWTSITAGWYSVCAIKSTGTLWCWGANDKGQLGQGDFTIRNVPTQLGALTTWASVDVGQSNMCAVKTDGTAWCTGWDGDGQIGSTGPSYRPAPAIVSGSWSVVANGTDHSCAIKTTGTLWCWGATTYGGELGDGISGPGSYHTAVAPVQVGVATTWSKVTSGVGVSCAIRTNGTLWCWGKNWYGELGVGDTTMRDVPTQVGVATTWATVLTSGYATCATKTDGTLWCWGRNDAGQVGDGSTTDRTSPTQVGVLTTWARVGVGTGATCAVKTTGQLFCWGANSSGQLGLGTLDYVPHSTPAQVGALTTWAYPAGGGDHMCSTRTDGTLWCWGYGPSGQLGDGSGGGALSPVQAAGTTWAEVAAGRSHTCGRTTTGSVSCWGANDDGQLGTGDLQSANAPTALGGATWASIWTGESEYTSCGIDTSAVLRCWGANNLSQLGINVSNYVTTLTQIGTDTNWSKVHPGNYFLTGSKTDNTVWAWGSNYDYSLGMGLDPYTNWDHLDRMQPNIVAIDRGGRASGAA